MSTTRGPVPQSLDEVRTHIFDYTEDLLEGVVVTSATITHVPPSGDAATVTPTVVTPKVFATVGPLSVKGQHFLDCLAECDDGEKLHIRLELKVRY